MILETLQNDVKRFMKEKMPAERDMVRLILSEVKNKEIELKRQLVEGEVLGVISTLAKKVTESLGYAKENNDEARIAEYSKQLEILESYTPTQMTADEIKDLAEKIIKHGDFSGKKDLGKVMQLIRPQTVGRADGKLVSQIVAELLG